MRNLNFEVEGGRENVVKMPIDNPGTATTGRVLVDTGNGMVVRDDIPVTIENGVAVLRIPAALASQMYNVTWVLQALEGTTPVSVAQGKARLSNAGSEAVEINNADGIPIPVTIDRTTTQPVSGTVELGATTLAALETTALDADTLAALETVSLGPSSAIIGYTSAALSRKVGEGKVFIAGAAITLGGLASTERACLQVVNPATSTKALYIFALTVYSSITQQVVYMENAEMGGTPTVMTPFNINRASAVTSIATASSSTAAPTGGASWPNQSRVQGDAPLNLQFPPIVLPPGKSLLIRGTIGDAQTFTANAYWFEE